MADIELIGSEQSTCDITWAYRYSGHVESVTIKRRNWRGKLVGAVSVEIGERETTSALLARALELAASLDKPKGGDRG